MKSFRTNVTVFTVLTMAIATTAASAAVVTAPTQVLEEIEQHTTSAGPMNTAWGRGRAMINTTVGPEDTFTVRIAAPAGQRFAFTPTVAPENTNNLLLYLALPDPAAEDGTWSTASLGFSFVGLEGSLTGTQSLTMEANNGRGIRYDFENLTQAFTFEAIDLTFAVPSDATGPLLVEYGDIIGEKFNQADDAGIAILDMDNPVLTIVPEPGTASLLLISAAGVMLRRRGRIGPCGH